eukprot:2007590-Prymnesium_polylepis.3
MSDVVTPVWMQVPCECTCQRQSALRADLRGATSATARIRHTAVRVARVTVDAASAVSRNARTSSWTSSDVTVTANARRNETTYD